MRFQYPHVFIEAVKELIPDDPVLHEALDSGDPMAGPLLLQHLTTFNKEPFDPQKVAKHLNHTDLKVLLDDAGWRSRVLQYYFIWIHFVAPKFGWMLPPLS